MSRPVTDKNRLSTNHPNLPAYIDPELNDGLTVDNVASGSHKLLTWTCINAGHTFKRKPYNAVKKSKHGSYTSCPECRTLAYCNPDIAAEWHPTKNDTPTPEKVTYGSATKFWWRCKNPECPQVGGHEWQAAPSTRTKGHGCPACSNSTLTDKNRLSSTYMEIAIEWHSTKNGTMTPDDVPRGSNKKVWWQCKNPDCPVPDGYEWQATINSRTGQKVGCASCAGKVVSDKNSIAANHPDLHAYINPELNNGLTIDSVASGSHQKIVWTCKNAGHTFIRVAKQAVDKRNSSYARCPECTKLAFHDPIIAAEWHPSKNGDLTPEAVDYGSNKKVWWQCKNPGCPVPDGYEWQAIINSRVGQKVGCPACAGKAVTDKNRLTIRAKPVAKEWVRCLDCKKPADKHARGSNHRAQWRCNLVPKHEWDAVIVSRTLAGRGCPKCNPKRSRHEIKIACELASVFPRIAPENTARICGYNCDIYDPDNNLVIEYDSHYWHKEFADRTEKDIEKTTHLESEGIRVIRVREHPLEALPSIRGIECNADYSDAGVKIVVDSVLRYIAKEFGISNGDTNAYLTGEGLANAELAESLIANEYEIQLTLPI